MIERIMAADMYSIFVVAAKLNEVIDYLNRHEHAEDCDALADLRACRAVPVIGCQAVDVRVPVELWAEITAPAEGAGAVE